MRTVTLWLFVINLGIACGAGLYEHRIVVPRWIDNSGGIARWHAEAARRDDTGRRFWAFVTTVPLTLLTLASLYFAWQTTGTLYAWWLTASVLALADRAITFGYFIPAMIRLMRFADSPEAAAVASQWSNLNTVRHLILISAWIAALRAFGVLYQDAAK